MLLTHTVVLAHNRFPLLARREHPIERQTIDPTIGPSRVPALAAPLLAFAFLCAAYALSISNHLTEDSLWYAHDVLRPTELYFHPHHLLYDPLMRMVELPVDGLLAGPDAELLFLQWVNIVLGAASMSVFCLALMRLGTRALHALAITLLLGLCAFSYSYSSQIEVYSLTVLFLGVSLIGLARGPATPAGSLLAGAGYACALFFHQTAIFFGLAIVTCGILAAPRGLASASRTLARCLLAPLAIVGLVYVAAGVSLGHRDPVSFWRWLTLHVQWGHWGHGTLSAETLGLAVRRLAQAVLAPGPGLLDLPWLILLAALGAYVAAGFGERGRSAARHPSLLAGCLVWMTALAVFTTWWDARGAEFWGMFLMPVCVVLALLSPADSEPPPSGGRQRALRVAAACGLALMLIVVAATDVVLHRRNLSDNDLRQAARALGDAAVDGDLILAAGTDAATYDRIYVGDRRVEILAINVKPAREAAGSASGGTFTQRLLERIVERARAVETAGGRCLIDRRILTGNITTTRLTEGLDPAQVRSGLRETFEITPLGGGRAAPGSAGGPNDDDAIYRIRPR